MSEALKTLSQSMDKSYELYHYLLILPIALTNLQEQRLDNARNKYLPDEADLNPNTKFIDNLFIAKLRDNEMLNEYLKALPLSWDSEEIYLRLALDKILNSEIYSGYMADENRSLAADCEFWREVMRKIVLIDENLSDVLEAKSIYWNDDLETIGTFVLKTIKRFAEDDFVELLPQFKDSEDRALGEKLFMGAVQIMINTWLLLKILSTRSRGTLTGWRLWTLSCFSSLWRRLKMCRRYRLRSRLMNISR